jgi:segregation and condensation protein B
VPPIPDSRRGRRSRAHSDGDLRPHCHRLSAAGDKGEISKLAGREINRDIIASLKRHGLIDGAIRAPQPGAPFAYVTTKMFLEAFGFASLRDLPDLQRLKADGLMQRDGGDADLDSALGLAEDEQDSLEDNDAL